MEVFYQALLVPPTPTLCQVVFSWQLQGPFSIHTQVSLDFIAYFPHHIGGELGFLWEFHTHVSSGYRSDVTVATLASLMFWNIPGMPLTQGYPFGSVQEVAGPSLSTGQDGTCTPPVTLGSA